MYILTNTDNNNQYIMASSNGTCNMQCLDTFLFNDIALPENFNLESYETKDIIAVQTRGEARFIQDNLLHNWLFVE